MVKVQVMISEPLMKTLKQISETKDLPLSDLFRRGMEFYVEKIREENLSREF